MQKIIGVTDLQRNFRSVFEEVTKDRMPYVLTRGSRPEAAIVPYEEFTRFMAWKEQEIVAEFDRAMMRLAEQNALYSDDEIAADVDAASVVQFPGLSITSASAATRRTFSSAARATRAGVKPDLAKSA